MKIAYVERDPPVEDYCQIFKSQAIRGKIVTDSSYHPKDTGERKNLCIYFGNGFHTTLNHEKTADRLHY